MEALWVARQGGQAGYKPPGTAPNSRRDSRTATVDRRRRRGAGRALRHGRGARRSGSPSPLPSLIWCSLAPAWQPLADRVAQVVDPLPGQRRDRDDIVAPRRFAEHLVALVAVEQVDLVPRLDPRRRARLVEPELVEHGLDIGALRVAVGVRAMSRTWRMRSADGHFLERRAERRDQLGRQVGDEADRVGQDRLVEAGQA